MRPALHPLAIAALLALAGCAHLRSAEETLSADEAGQVLARSLDRVARGGPNHLHLRRLYFYAPPFAEAAHASLDLVRAAALLHDATKEDGRGAPKERFCDHGEDAAVWSVGVLTALGKSPAFAQRASEAIRQHMGPCGRNEEWGDERFMTKFCRREYPPPSSAEAQVLYDLDMLDLMTVDGVVKVVELRQRGAEFEREPLEDSAVRGGDSAWKSVRDAQQTLLTPLARQCGAALVEHTHRFLLGVDWARVPDVAAFKVAARAWLEQYPLPACLPTVPPGDDVR